MIDLNAVVIDFETRSKCDLLTQGSDKYAKHESTEVLCCAFRFLSDGARYAYDKILKGEDLPTWVRERLLGCDFYMAHNARFDQAIWEFVATADNDFPELDPDKWYCTSAQARANALPPSLEKAARALSGEHQKDHRGAALIRKFSIPRKEDGEFNEMTLDDRVDMLGYCVKDVEATVGIVQGSRLLTAEEHEDWIVNERINDRGICIDLETAKLATEYAGAEQAALAKEITEISAGAATKHTQHARIKNFVLSEIAGTEDEKRITAEMTVYVKGEEKTSLAKDIRANILNLADCGDIEISDAAYNIIMCSDEGNKSSVAKFKRMVSMADEDTHRVSGVFLFAGAGQTLRYSSKAVQVHNFSRTCFKPDEADEIARAMKKAESLPDVMLTLSKMLRPALIPAKGKTFVVGDWSAIEGRFLPWLSDSKGGEKVLDVFRRDEDIYLHTAATMKIDDRQIGKVATLSLGYQGGVNAFNSMGRNYGIYLPEARAKRIVDGWRNANQWAVKFWKDLETAAMRAMRSPETDFTAGRVKYRFVKGLMGGTLVCILPSGGCIQYPKARLEKIETQWGAKTQITYLKASINPAADAKEWARGSLYGGLLAENATQAIAAALLRENLRELADDPVVMHVHDEIVLEVDIEDAEVWIEDLQSVMEFVPEWATGLPLKAVPEKMDRYGK